MAEEVNRRLGHPVVASMHQGAAFIAFDAYQRCNGDVDAMADFLMGNVMAEAVRQLEDSPPLDFDGHLVCPVEAMRKLLRLQLHRVAAIIESQNHSRH